MNIVIRKAEKKDIRSLIALLKDLFEIESDFSFDEQRQRKGLELLIDSSKDCVLVAEHDATVVGMCSVQTMISTAQGGYVGLVEDLIIDKKFRRNGIGKRLLDEIAKWSIQRKLSRLQLLTDKGNSPTLKFYSKLNWKETNLIALRKLLDNDHNEPL